MTTLNLASQRDLIKALLQFRPNQFRSRRGGGGGGGCVSPLLFALYIDDFEEYLPQIYKG